MISVTVEILRETKMSVQVTKPMDRGNEPAWLPKSLIKLPVRWQPGETIKILIPKWLATQNKLK